jgi:hypothetical protein
MRNLFIKRSLFLASVLFVLATNSAFASRDFTSASSQRIDLNTTLGNWEYTQAWSAAVWISMKTNAGACMMGKSDATANNRGWIFFVATGSSFPKLQFTIQNATTAHVVVQSAADQLTLNTYHHVVMTYNGNGLASGVTMYVDGASVSKTTVADNLVGSTILNAVPAQIGAKGGTGAPVNFLNGLERRLLLYNVALTAQNVTDLYNDAVTPYSISGLQAWYEFGAKDDGATLVTDLSGNGNWGRVTGAVYSSTDPAGIKTRGPNIGTTGVTTLSGQLTKTTPEPFMQNLGWSGGANAGVSDQIGPGAILKLGAGNYIGFIENDTGAKALDVGNQGGTFQYDTPSIYATSPDGTTWNFNGQQDVSSSAVFNVNNIVSGLTAGQTTTFKAAVSAETSVSTLMFDPDDNVWKAWFHGGNNSPGTRRIYYAKCNSSSIVTCTTAGNWQVQNGGVCVVCEGAGGSWNSGRSDGAIVVRRSSNLMVMIFEGADGSNVNQIGEAESTDRGLTWTPYAGNPVIAKGAAGSWDVGSVFQPGFTYDTTTGKYIAWYGGCPTGVFTDTDGIGFAYSNDAKAWTRGSFNPVLTKNVNATGTNAFEDIIANSVNLYLDGGTYRMMIKADNGNGTSAGFRGRIEATMQQSGAGLLRVVGGGIF